MQQLEERMGRSLERSAAPLPLEKVELPPPRLSARAVAKLQEACGGDGVRSDHAERATHAVGRSLPDLFRLRSGALEWVPDAVVYPRDEAAVAATLRACADFGIAVVPFGGGTSVVGGVEARHSSEQAGVVALDTTRLDAVLAVDPTGGVATFQAGIDGPALEAALRRHGLTLGHFPQSFEYSTLGGWIATRSSGQQSNGYGGIDRLLVSLRLATPEGVLRTLEVPHSAAGPDLNQVVLGSEGTLGVIVQATMRVSPAPTHQDVRAVLLREFSDGVNCVRELVQGAAGLDLLRLSDSAETELALVQRRDPERSFDPTSWVLRGLERFGYGDGRALLLYGAEGSHGPAVRAAVARARACARHHRGMPLGRAPGRSWRHERFRAPYLRDWLLDHGVAVDTFETALPWSQIETGHQELLRAIGAAARAHAGGGIPMAHLSHSYRDGACLYFTLLYPVEPGAELSQWTAIKRDVTDAIVGVGGTLSHHHGVGIDHAPWLEAEKGETGMALLRSLKRTADPSGVMNPGKLL
jgi:alkyldihydroxyacetonephosphate synthase